MTPAIVVLWVPDGAGETVDVTLPLWRPCFTSEEAHRVVAGDTTLILREAADAYQYGNPAAPVVAARLLRSRPDLRWPAWLADAVVDALEHARPQALATDGRHANAWRQWRDDAADYLRYRAVEILRHSGARVPGVYHEVAARLPLEGAAHAARGADAIDKSCQRVIARTGPSKRKDAPYLLRYHPRYFPDIVTLHWLHAADVIRNERPRMLP